MHSRARAHTPRAAQTEVSIGAPLCGRLALLDLSSNGLACPAAEARRPLPVAMRLGSLARVAAWAR
jgi:hypothetical protein